MILVSFFNEVDTRKELSSAPLVSLFNEVEMGTNYPRALLCFLTRSTQDQNYPRDSLIHFLMRLTQGKNHPQAPIHGPYENMSPKRSSQDGRSMLQEKHMSLDTNDRLGSNVLNT